MFAEIAHRIGTSSVDPTFPQRLPLYELSNSLDRVDDNMFRMIHNHAGAVVLPIICLYPRRGPA